MEVVGELAVPFSVSVVCDLVGLPDEGRERLLPWARLGFDSWGPPGPRAEAAAVGYQSLVDYSNTVSVPEHLEPGRWGAGIYDAVDRGDLEQEAIHGVVFAYLQAGMDTTVNAIGTALYLFAQYPDQWDQVRSDPNLIPSAVNEVLRYHSPIQRYTRVANDDIELGGVTVPAHNRVVVLIGSGNRDERRFDDPDRFDVTRNPIDHLAFGRGLHHCAGAGLARLELSAVLTRLAERVRRFEIRRPRVGHQLHRSWLPLARSHSPHHLTGHAMRNQSGFWVRPRSPGEKPNSPRPDGLMRHSAPRFSCPRGQLAPAVQPATPTMRSTSTRAKGWSRYCG